MSLRYSGLAATNHFRAMGAGVCGAIDASSLSPQLQILAAQVGLSPQLRHSQLSIPSRNCWQVVLIIQLVVQIKLAPFIEVKLDVVSDRRRCCTTFHPAFRLLAGGSGSDGRASDVDVVWHGARFDLPCSMPSPAQLRYVTCVQPAARSYVI
jgi:hypothetical protein